MNILIVTQHYLNGNGGGVFASRAYINAIADIYAPYGTVSLLYPAAPGHPLENIALPVNAIPVEDDASRPVKLLRLLTGRSNRFLNIFPKTLKSLKPDLVVFDNSRISHRLIKECRKAGIRTAVIHHNCELEYVRDNTPALLRPSSIYWTRRSEGEAVCTADLNLVLTPEDRDLLIRHYHPDTKSHPIEVLGVFESSKRHLPAIAEPSKQRDASRPGNIRFVITGNLSARQTELSLLPWLKTYWPLLKGEFPDGELTVAGRSPSAAITEACNGPGITLIPSPPDMDEVLKGQDVYICPTSLGGGLKLRIMDGLRHGLPVLTHAVSARGYGDFKDAGILFEYSDPDSFKTACNRLKQTLENINKTQARTLYTSIFSFEAGRNRLKKLVKTLPN